MCVWGSRFYERLLNISLIDEMKVKRDFESCAYESELYTYLNTLVNQCRIYADLRRIKLRVNKTFGYISCQTNDTMITSALQNLLIYTIDVTPYGGCVNIMVSYHVDAWSLYISNSSEKVNKKWITLIPRLISLWDHKNLRIVRNIIHLYGGQIVENRKGCNLDYQITIPIKYHCGKIKCSVIENFQMRKIENSSYNKEFGLEGEEVLLKSDIAEMSHILLVVTDNELSDYLFKILSTFFRITIVEKQEEVFLFIVQYKPDLIIIDENVGGIYGEELCRQVKLKIGKFNIPVILLVNYSNSKNFYSNIECGADKLEIRTVSICRLKADIQELINNRIILNQYIEGKLSDKPSFAVLNTVIKDDYNVQFIDKVNHFLDENLSIDGYTVEMLSVDIGMSRTGFYTKIKGITGKSPAEYIFNFKMEKAKILLETQQYKITEMANLLGFCDSKYFGKRFRKIYKMSPTDYLKSLLK